MLQKIIPFYLNHAFKIMITGFALSAAGMILLIQAQHRNALLRQAGFGVAAAGICLYIIGRVGIIVAQRRARKLREKSIPNDAGENKEPNA